MRPVKWFIVTLATAMTLGTANIGQAKEVLTAFENSYTAKLYGFSIEATSRFKVTGPETGNYQFSFDADSVVGSIMETTDIIWNEKDQVFIPQRYTYKRTGIGKGRDDELVFDWASLKVTNIKNNKTLTWEANTKLQDSLSYQLQLRQDLLAGKNNLEYTITNGRKIKKYRFEIVGEETLKTPLGEVKTVKIKRSNTGENTATYAWFAKNFSYLLVQLQQEENGSAYTIYLSKAAINGKAIEHF